MKKDWCLLVLGCAALLLVACSTMGPFADGSGTETTTGYTATAVYPDGTRAAGALVRVRSIDYFQQIDSSKNIGIRYDTVTDNAGRFHFSRMDTGRFVIEVNDRKKFTVAVRCDIRPADSLVDLGTWTVRPYANLSGTLDTPGVTGGLLYVAVRGLERLSLTAANGAFVINNMPEGNFEIHVFTDSAANARIVLDNVKTISGSTFSVKVPSCWQYSRLVYFNTTASGAGIGGDVTGFPVLIRLIASNFDFTQAADSGRDLRFTKTDGSLLSRQIERFSRPDNAAEIWVKADTVYGNDSTRAMVMSWGNPAASMVSNGPAVFDTANGFLGVWHLSEAANATAYDATGNGHDGVNYGASDTTGIIGNCKAFHGNDSVMIAGLLGMPHTVTISAWAQTFAADTGSYEILSIGGYISMRIDINQVFSASGLFHIRDDNSPVFTWLILGAQFSPKSEWHYLTYSIDSAGQTYSISVDGAAPTVNAATDSVYFSGLRDSTCIGGYAIGNNQYDFIGNIDEVRVSTVVRSADWNRLCYMNQKEPDALVKMK
jgi:Concanavalin A-like lectin/glucanases superfamily/Domain of unknown function (DUF2341)